MGCCPAREKVNPDKPVHKLAITPGLLIPENKGNYYHSYRIGELISKTSCGSIYVSYHRDTNRLCATKMISKNTLSEPAKARLMQEIRILKEMDHPNIIKLFEVFVDNRQYYLITELCTGGDLWERVAKERRLTERTAATVMKQLLSGLHYCHLKNIVHRNLKPQNILFESDSASARLKISEFASSQLLDPGQKMKLKIGTPYYISPEVLRQCYDSKCDIWSCGVMLYILLSGVPPFDGATQSEIINKIKHGSYTMLGPIWDSISSPAKDLIKHMLEFDPDHRVTAGEALNHPWITQFKKRALKHEETRELFSEMQVFGAQHKLQQATLTYIASQLTTQKEKHLLEEAFLSLDRAGNGKLSAEELILGFKEVFGEGFPAEEEVKKIMERLDIDGSGYINYTEFMIATLNKSELLSKSKLEAAFRMFDKDGSGKISITEIEQILGGSDLIPKDFISSLKKESINSDNEISLEEFLSLMNKLNT